MQYRAWGLTIDSAVALPLALETGGGAADVFVCLVDVSDVAAGPVVEWTPSVSLLSWPEVGSFVLRDGRTVAVSPAFGATSSELAAAIAGPVLALLLLQRGALVLHASAVALLAPNGSERAVIFVGAGGEGKSTFAAALAARGHRALCDDIVALWPSSDGPTMVAPGVPFVKLRAPSLEALGHGLHTLPTPEGLPITAPSWTPNAAPLSAIYDFGRADEVRLEPLAPPEALGVLLRHSVAQSVLDAPPPEDLARAAMVAKAGVVQRLWRPHDWGLLEEVVGAVSLECGT